MDEDTGSFSSRVSASVSSRQSTRKHPPMLVEEDVPEQNGYSGSEEVETHIRQQLRPVTHQQLTESLQLIQYDVHREVQSVIREQVRQFSIAKVSNGLFMKISTRWLYLGYVFIFRRVFDHSNISVTPTYF